MGRIKQPVDLVLAKGKKHLTKEEIKERKSQELQVDLVNISTPEYLTSSQKREFEILSEKLQHIKIMTELDEETLARYIITNDEYKKIDKRLQRSINSKKFNIEKITEIQKVHDKLLKQVRGLASDLGLTITSRMKIVVPKSEEEPKENKFSKFVVKK
jgi:P27 family predicted phage terminase small subunit